MPLSKSSLPAWKIWKNPIFLRYCRSRLRPKKLIPWLFISLIIAGFLFATSRQTAVFRGTMELMDAERMPIFPLIIWQGILLFLFGSGQVAGGMTTEADERTLDYQRLAPLSPLTKTLGYLFGLPVREYVLFLSTLPFTFWAFWQGQVPFSVFAQVYGSFMVAAVLYHLTGLVAGTVVRNRRTAFLVSMGVVFLLYTVVPYASKFGLVYFQFFTIRPVIEDNLIHLTPRTFGAGYETLRNLIGGASFFAFSFPTWVYTLVAQGVLIATGINMVWRRWNRAESHLLGKAWALALFLWTLFLIIGNALPLVQSGDIFFSRAVQSGFGRVFTSTSWRAHISEALFTCGIFGTASLILMILLTLAITGTRNDQVKGWRRRLKAGKNSLKFGSDPASSFVWAFAMALGAAAGWFFFSQGIVESHWFPGRDLPPFTFPLYALTLLTATLLFQTFLEADGGVGKFKLWAFLGAILPILISVVLFAGSDSSTLATWIALLSPLTWPLAVCYGLLFPDVMTSELIRPLPVATLFWISSGALLSLRLALHLRKARKEVRQSIS